MTHTFEVRWRKKGTKTWHHDRIPGKKNRYWYKGKMRYQKKEAHRTFRSMDDVKKRMIQLKKEHGSDIEFYIKGWGARRK